MHFDPNAHASHHPETLSGRLKEAEELYQVTELTFNHLHCCFQNHDLNHQLRCDYKVKIFVFHKWFISHHLDHCIHTHVLHSVIGRYLVDSVSRQEGRSWGHSQELWLFSFAIVVPPLLFVKKIYFELLLARKVAKTSEFLHTFHSGSLNTNILHNHSTITKARKLHWHNTSN